MRRTPVSLPAELAHSPRTRLFGTHNADRLAILLVMLMSAGVAADTPKPNPARPSARPQTPAAYRGDSTLVQLRESAERGDAQATWDLCQLYSGSTAESSRGVRVAPNAGVAFDWCLQAASHGQVRAGGMLGAMYYAGKGIPQDFSQALRWTRPAATAGISEAQFLLGLMFSKGQGTFRDEREAFSWILKAAEQGYALAQESVAGSLLSGRGAARDVVEAQKWLDVCATHESDAQRRCSALRDANAKSMTATDLEEAQRRSVEWFANCRRPSDPRWNVVCH